LALAAAIITGGRRRVNLMVAHSRAAIRIALVDAVDWRLATLCALR
jgi:hypothetical protein